MANVHLTKTVSIDITSLSPEQFMAIAAGLEALMESDKPGHQPTASELWEELDQARFAEGIDGLTS